MSRRSRSPLNNQARAWLLRAAVVMLVVVGGYLLYELGRIRADYNIVAAAQERRDYESRIANLEEEIVGLREKITMLETHRDIDVQAYRDVEASLTELQAKIQEQRDAIAFYRGIVSPADGAAGLRVQDLKLTRGRTEREYNLKLVLVQAMQHDRKVTGDVSLSVAGEQDGVDTTYSYADLKPDDEQQDWSFSFRYFQDFDRALVLPDGFTPELVRVEVRSRTRSVASIEESFSWVTS